MRSVLSVGLCVFLLGCNDGKPAGQAGRKTVKRSEFTQRIRDAQLAGGEVSPAKMIELFGKPDKTVDSSSAGISTGYLTWYYYGLTVDDANGRVDETTTITFSGFNPVFVTATFN